MNPTLGHIFSLCGFCLSVSWHHRLSPQNEYSLMGCMGGAHTPHQFWCTGRRRLRLLHQGVRPCVLVQAYLQSQPRSRPRGFLRWGRGWKSEDAFALSLSGLALCCPHPCLAPRHLRESSAQSSLDRGLNPHLRWSTCLTRSCAWWGEWGQRWGGWGGSGTGPVTTSPQV